MTSGTIAILVLLIYIIGYFPSVIIIAMLEKRISYPHESEDRYPWSVRTAILWPLAIPVVGLFVLCDEGK